MTATTDETADPGDPASLLPEDSVLSFEEYMAMQRAIGQTTRFRILHYLNAEGNTSPKELKAALDLAGNSLHHHLNTLVDVGLVEKRARSEADTNGLFTYYRSTAFGQAILEHGVEELLRREADYLEMYSGEE